MAPAGHCVPCAQTESAPRHVQAPHQAPLKGQLLANEVDDDENMEPSQHATGRKLTSRIRGNGSLARPFAAAQIQALSAAGLGFSQESLERGP